MSRSVLALAGLAGLALIISSCSHTRTVGRKGTVRVALTEYRLEPQSVSTSARQLTIVVHNYGRMTHNFVLRKGSQPTGKTEPIWPGRTATLSVTVTRGTYLMASTILSDQTLGTFGTLVVK